MEQCLCTPVLGKASIKDSGHSVLWKAQSFFQALKDAFPVKFHLGGPEMKSGQCPQ